MALANLQIAINVASYTPTKAEPRPSIKRALSILQADAKDSFVELMEVNFGFEIKNSNDEFALEKLLANNTRLTAENMLRTVQFHLTLDHDKLYKSLFNNPEQKVDDTNPVCIKLHNYKTYIHYMNNLILMKVKQDTYLDYAETHKIKYSQEDYTDIFRKCNTHYLNKCHPKSGNRKILKNRHFDPANLTMFNIDEIVAHITPTYAPPRKF